MNKHKPGQLIQSITHKKRLCLIIGKRSKYAIEYYDVNFKDIIFVNIKAIEDNYLSI